MTRYFAYGANLDPVHMGECCPTARWLGTAILAGHGFRIAAAGYGNAVAAPGETVYGVLWELEPADEAALDAFEGMGEGLYRKAHTTVCSADGEELSAMLYLPTDSAPGRPVAGYLERIIEVAKSLAFPAGYVEELQARIFQR
ncbi:MAG TPA: gamma-glutamylcyclotransferase family protein [Gemmatimonadales bacterium]|jgi:gamma-glutamylcyclotransferase (GGCT)/AIG2-like uncharacterized protein YtfP|nr:gamma-glutamylcyclotransferase family protein [Gemmatimonadales bacterium]